MSKLMQQCENLATWPVKRVNDNDRDRPIRDRKAAHLLHGHVACTQNIYACRFDSLHPPGKRLFWLAPGELVDKSYTQGLAGKVTGIFSRHFDCRPRDVGLWGFAVRFHQLRG